MSTARATSGRYDRCNRLTVGFFIVSQTRRKERQALKLAAKHREKNRLSQQQMAKFMGTGQQAVSRIESGEYEGFTLKTLEKIVEATGTKVKIEFVAA
jgi:transcriptional regulator with XRE-family HTH domain